MSHKKITISGTGCALADFLYNDISFDKSNFTEFLSRKAGDGGLSPGRLVFTEELEKFSGKSYKDILEQITGGDPPVAFNLGGPSLVSLIHTSQMLDSNEFEVKFFGLAGRDKISDMIFRILEETPLNISNYRRISNKATPFTDVFSDPAFDGGQGERTFVNNIGAAWDYESDMITDDFFSSEIICFGGTALVPNIHDNLTSLLEKAKKKNCITVVNTVFDFRNEKNNPGTPWPLGNSKITFGLIDILIMDREEALKISGQRTIDDAALFFVSSNVSSFIITNGAENIYVWSAGRFFRKTKLLKLPVSDKVMVDMRTRPELRGDTTGCGDNFAGGIIASAAHQIKYKERGSFDMIEALSLGVASGGYSCYIMGGTYIEKFPGEKITRVLELQKEYLKQIGI
jgi:sugar/nucleoside kinase (ribokinase family)